MLVGMRNIILTGSLVFTFLLLILLLISMSQVFSSFSSSEDFSALESNTWWFTYKQLALKSVSVSSFIGIISIIVLIIVCSLVLRISYKKTSSPELFFYLIFLFSFSFESFRILNLFLHFYKAPLYLSLLIVRIVYFGRIFGILSLICSSLYAVEIKYEKFTHLIGISVLLALFLASSLPLDSSNLLTNFLYKIVDELGIFILNFSFVLVILINFIISAAKHETGSLLIPLSLLLTLAGREILFFAIHPGIIIFCLLLILGGTIIFFKQINKIYLWA